MPKYQCHKQVWALKIASITDRKKSGATLHFAEEGYDSVDVTADWVEKHAPKAGGYYVAYDADYASYSPADVFEKGYTLIK
jgi:hypothetical protein